MSEAERDGVDLLPKQLETTWEAFAEAVDADVGEAVLGIARDPAGFVAEFERCGTTLIHGDLRDEQLGIDGERVIAIDWGLASNAHPAFELAWYMMHCRWRIEASHEQIVEDFRRAMGERDDPRALELGLISGLVQYGWILGNSALHPPRPRGAGVGPGGAGLVGAARAQRAGVDRPRLSLAAAAVAQRAPPAAVGAVGSSPSSPRCSRERYSSAISGFSLARSTIFSSAAIEETSSTCSLMNHCMNCSPW